MHSGVDVPVNTGSIDPLIKVDRFARKNNDVPYKESNLCKLAGFVEDFCKDHDNPRYVAFQCLKLNCEPFELTEKALIPYLANRIKEIPEEKRTNRELEKTLKRNKKSIESLKTTKGKKQLKNYVYNREFDGTLALIIQIETERAKWIGYFKQYYTSESWISRKAGEEIKRRFGFNPDWNNKSKNTLWRNIPKNYQEKVDAKEFLRINKIAELHPPLFPDDFHRKGWKGTVTKNSQEYTSIARQNFLRKRKRNVF